MLSKINLHRCIRFRTGQLSLLLLLDTNLATFNWYCNWFAWAARRTAWLSVQGVCVQMRDESALRCSSLSFEDSRISLVLEFVITTIIRIFWLLSWNLVFSDQTTCGRIILKYCKRPWLSYSFFGSLRMDQIEEVLPLEKWKFALNSQYLLVARIEQRAAIDLRLIRRRKAIYGSLIECLLCLLI